MSGSVKIPNLAYQEVIAISRSIAKRPPLGLKRQCPENCGLRYSITISSKLITKQT